MFSRLFRREPDINLVVNISGADIAKRADARISELLEHNSAQLEENRAQRRVIKRLEDAIQELLNRDDDYLHYEDRAMLCEAVEPSA